MHVETIEEGKPSYENIHRGVEIYIEANPDHYRGGLPGRFVGMRTNLIAVWH